MFDALSRIFPALVADNSRGDDPPDPPAVGFADGGGVVPLGFMRFAHLAVAIGGCLPRGRPPGPPAVGFADGGLALRERGSYTSGD